MSIWDRLTGKTELRQELQQANAQLDLRRRQRYAMRTAVRHAAHFNSANRDRLTDGWDTTPYPINQQLQQELLQLVARSRQLAKNDPYFRRFLGLAKNNVVGHAGFRFAANIKQAGGDKLDKRASRAIEMAWKKASKKGALDYRGRLSLVQMANLMLTSLLRDGEVLALKVRSRRVNEFGFAIQLLDPLLLQVSSDHIPGRPGHQVTLGVEFDRSGRRVAYWLHSTDTTHDDYYTLHGRGFLRIPAARVIHEYLDEYIDQARGIPIAGAVALRHHMLDGYENAELVGARLSASTMGIIKRGEEDQGWDGDGEPGYDDEAADFDDDFHMDVEGGTFQMLPNGAELQTWDPQHPNQAFKDFIKGVLRGIAAGLGVSYFSLANDLEGVNFSSGRLGALEDREVWKALQDWMIENLLQPIFDEWLGQALLMGAVRLSGGTPLNPAGLDRYRDGASFKGRRWAWVDPQKEMAAHREAYELRVTSLSEIIRERGREPHEVWDELEREDEELRKRGLTPQQVLDKAAAPESDDDNPEHPDDETET